MAKMLVADDDTKIRDMLQTTLRDHELTLARTWPEVQEKLDAESFDLVITDVVMPGYKELLPEGIRAIFEKRRQPVIFISGYSEGALRDLPSFMRFVKKPFSVRMLRNFVARALDAIQGGGEEGAGE